MSGVEVQQNFAIICGFSSVDIVCCIFYFTRIYLDSHKSDGKNLILFEFLPLCLLSFFNFIQLLWTLFICFEVIFVICNLFFKAFPTKSLFFTKDDKCTMRTVLEFSSKIKLNEYKCKMLTMHFGSFVYVCMFTEQDPSQEGTHH